MEGLTRIELASSVWKTEALPLSYSPEIDGNRRSGFNCGAPPTSRSAADAMQHYYIDVTDPCTRVQVRNGIEARLHEVHPPDEKLREVE